MSLFLLIAGIAAAVYGLAVLPVTGLGQWSNLLLLIIGIILILLSRLWKFLFKSCRPAGVVLALLLGLCLLLFLAVEGKIIAAGCLRPESRADWVILLGARVGADGPSAEYMARIRACADYLKENPDARAVASGGKGADEPISEAAAARAILMELGIEESRILTEEKSTSTAENLTFSKAVIEGAGGNAAEDSVVIVSSAFHLYRAAANAEKLGYGHVSGKGSHGLLFLIPYYYIREFVCCAVEFLSQ